MADIYTIPDYGALPEDACRWPACATPICERNENGTCPLSDDFVGACSRCGAAIALSTLRCPVCDAPTEATR